MSTFTVHQKEHIARAVECGGATAMEEAQRIILGVVCVEFGPEGDAE